MTRLIPTDATHMLDNVYYRLPRNNKAGLPALFWSEGTAQWHEVAADKAARLGQDLLLHGCTVAFTRQY